MSMAAKLPPLHALSAFESVARHRSFAKAAEELCLTNSAVSHRIKQLEDCLRTKVFSRCNRKVALTPAGARFLETVQDTLQRLQAASSQLSSGDRVTLRVSASPAIGSNWLAYRVVDFQTRHPRIDLAIEATMALASLRNGEADVCVRYGSGTWPDCHAVKLFTDELFAVCSPAYARKAGPFREPGDLKKATILRTTRKLPWSLWFRAAGLDWPEPSSGLLFGEVSVLLDAASNDAGIALAGRIASAPYLHSGRLIRLFDIGVPAPRSFYAVCLEDHRDRPEVAAFVDWLVQQASENVFQGAADSTHEREKRLLAIVDDLPAGAVLVEGENLTINKRAEEITGYSRDELRTLRDWFTALYGHGASSARHRYEDDRAKRVVVVRTSRIRRKDGMYRLVELSGHLNPAYEVWLIKELPERRRRSTPARPSKKH